LSVGIMWYVELMVRGIFIQRPMLRDVVVAGVGCELRYSIYLLNVEITQRYGQYKYNLRTLNQNFRASAELNYDKI
jgi:hypothetical protein